jgi:hypothetical protein
MSCLVADTDVLLLVFNTKYLIPLALLSNAPPKVTSHVPGVILQGNPQVTHVLLATCSEDPEEDE